MSSTSCAVVLGSFVLGWCAVPDASAQSTWYVDDDTCPSLGTGSAANPFCSIQDGIAAAVDGDTVLVNPGTYFEGIDFLGKAIIVVAVNPDPTLTVIDASASGPAASFQSGETSAARLEGLTLTGGSGVSVGGLIVGGNLYVTGASPTLENLVVRDNVGAPYRGGGAWFNQSNTLLDGVVFLHCNSGTDGGGLYAVASSLVLDHCRFETCFATSEGGGLYIESCSSFTMRDSDITGGNEASYAGGILAQQTYLDVSGCTFDGNIADENSGGGMGLLFCDGLVNGCSFTNNAAQVGYGGGVDIYGDTPLTLQDCEFRTNFASSDGNHIGVHNPGPSNGPTITGCRCSDARTCVYVEGAALFEDDDFAGVSNGFFGVQVHGHGATRFVGVSIHGFDEGIFFYDTDVASLERSRVTDNRYVDFEADDGSGVVEDCLFSGSECGAFCDNADILFDGCTITGNSHPSNYPGGLDAVGASAPTVRDSIIRGNSPIEIKDSTGGLLKVEYCDVGGGWSGTGNIDADPLFVDALTGDYSLQAGSPCIDTGDPAFVTTRRDIVGRPRRLDGALVRTERLDMGAFEFGQLTLAVSGNATPGGTVTIDTSGNPALVVFLLVSLDAAEIDHKFLGTFYVDFTSMLLIPWGSPPTSIQQTVPLGIPVPLSLHLQEVGILTANGSGATSNDVVVTLE
jgi:hypothetical protein